MYKYDKATEILNRNEYYNPPSIPSSVSIIADPPRKMYVNIHRYKYSCM